MPKKADSIPHYGYKAPVTVDESNTLIRAVTLRAANVHDRQEFENVVQGDEDMVMADKAYWSMALKRMNPSRWSRWTMIRSKFNAPTVRNMFSHWVQAPPVLTWGRNGN